MGLIGPRTTNNPRGGCPSREIRLVGKSLARLHDGAA
jgi:hypothetical protein